MNVKAEAFQEYNQAAVVDKLLTGMPEIVRALAAPLDEGRQDHDRLDRQRRLHRHAQAHRRHDRRSRRRCRRSSRRCRACRCRICCRRSGRSATRRRAAGSGAWTRTSAAFRTEQETRHGSTRTRRDARPREPERPDRPRGRSREDDQAGDPRHGEPAAAGEDAGGDFDGRPAPAAEEAEGAGGQGGGVDAQGGARGRQGAGRPGARRARALPELHASWPRATPQQVADQRQQVDTLRNALDKLDQKLGEARAKSDLLLAQHRRARALEQGERRAARDRRPVARRRASIGMQQKVSAARPSARPSPSSSPTTSTGGSTRWKRTTRVGRLLDELKSRRK